MNYYTNKLAVEQHQTQMLREAQQFHLARLAGTGEQRPRGASWARVLRAFGVLHPYIISVKSTKPVVRDNPVPICVEG